MDPDEAGSVLVGKVLHPHVDLDPDVALLLPLLRVVGEAVLGHNLAIRTGLYRRRGGGDTWLGIVGHR